MRRKAMRREAMRRVLGAGILLLLLSAAPATAQEAARAIEAANARFVQAFDRGDAAALGAMYTENAFVLPPEAKMVEGRKAIESFWDGAMRHGARNLTLRSLRVDELGDAAAREIGRFTLDMPARGGGLARVEGKYVVVWVKDGGDWRLETDIWNADGPPRTEPATGSSPPPRTGSGTGR